VREGHYPRRSGVTAFPPARGRGARFFNAPPSRIGGRQAWGRSPLPPRSRPRSAPPAVVAAYPRTSQAATQRRLARPRWSQRDEQVGAAGHDRRRRRAGRSRQGSVSGPAGGAGRRGGTVGSRVWGRARRKTARPHWRHTTACKKKKQGATFGTGGQGAGPGFEGRASYRPSGEQKRAKKKKKRTQAPPRRRRTSRGSYFRGLELSVILAPEGSLASPNEVGIFGGSFGVCRGGGVGSMPAKPSS